MFIIASSSLVPGLVSVAASVFSSTMELNDLLLVLYAILAAAFSTSSSLGPLWSPPLDCHHCLCLLIHHILPLVLLLLSGISLFSASKGQI